jgi:hypothetical protein
MRHARKRRVVLHRTCSQPVKARVAAYELVGTQYLDNYKGANKMQHEITFEGAELGSLSIRTAKSGNAYASGILILRNEQGKFEASLPFRSFDAVASLQPLEKAHFNPELLESTTGGDLHYEGENADTRERQAAKAASRPRVNVTGWLRTSKNSAGKWDTAFIVTSLHA